MFTFPFILCAVLGFFFPRWVIIGLYFFTDVVHKNLDLCSGLCGFLFLPCMTLVWVGHGYSVPTGEWTDVWKILLVGAIVVDICRMIEGIIEMNKKPKS